MSIHNILHTEMSRVGVGVALLLQIQKYSSHAELTHRWILQKYSNNPLK